MVAYRWVYDSRHLQADCQERDRLRNPAVGSRVWATFTFTLITYLQALRDADAGRRCSLPVVYRQVDVTA